MPKPFTNQEKLKDFEEALLSGMTQRDIQKMLSISDATANRWINKLITEGKIERLSVGKYRAREHREPIVTVYSNGKSPLQTVVENVARKITLPEFMKKRKPVTVYVERDAEEVSGCVRFEICREGNWMPIPLPTGDLRICVGTRVPIWSENQEWYEGVSCYRITLQNGEQLEFTHNVNHPLTVDKK